MSGAQKKTRLLVKKMDKITLINFAANFVNIFKNLIIYAIIARVIVSWFQMGAYGSRGRISKFIYDATDPFIKVARKIPHRLGMIDFAPLIAIIGVDLLGQMMVIGLAKLV